jgi:hypothetical protein
MIPDGEVAELVPPGREVATFQPQLPGSLRTAFLDFILAIAARVHRAGGECPASMLIHTSHRTAIQNRMGELVREHVTELRQRWRYDRNAIRPALRERWNGRFRPVIASINADRDVSFEALEEHIDRLFRDPLSVLVLNSSSDDVLDYETNPNVKAVLVGGNRLSRGLTLEGLLVSYYVRETPYFDTLLQMGRWFGYREEYVDLTRLWMTPELAGYFEDLALGEEELRREIARYERENLTPTDFGPRIRAHPVMMITAENKMGSARKVAQNFSGRLVGTTMFRLDDRGWLERNLETTRRFIHGLGRPNTAEDGRYIWPDVPAAAVDGFLAQYMTDPRATRIDVGPIRQYLSAQVEQRELTRWWVAVISQRQADVGTEDLGIVGKKAVNTISRTRKKNAPFSIGSLVNPATLKGKAGEGDEEIGLSEAQILRARAKAADEMARDPDTGIELGDALREERSKEEGLLLVYPISKRSRPRADAKERLALFDDPDRDGCTVIGIALVFPTSSSAATIEWIVGSVGTRLDEAHDRR